MATSQEVLMLIDNYNDMISKINDSSSLEETQRLANQAAQLSSGINFGNGTKYVEGISECFLDISIVAGTSSSTEAVEKLNSSLSNYSNYLQTSWWQFNDSERNGKIPFPKIEKLVY